MATGVLTYTINEIMTRLASIPYEWDTVEALSKNDATKLFQVIAMYNNQPQWWADGTIDGVIPPQVFIQLMPSAVTPLLSRGADMRDLNVRIHICDMQANQGDGLTIGAGDRNIRIFEYRDLVKLYLVPFKLKYGSHLIQVDEEQDYEHRQIYHYTIDFKAALVDSTASIYGDGVNPPNPFVQPHDAPVPDGWVPDITSEFLNEEE